MELLTSRSNPTVKNFRSLASSAQMRREQGLAFLEGQRLCCDAASSGATIEQLLITEAAMHRLAPQLSPLVNAAGLAYLISDGVAECISQTKSEQGVFALCRIVPSIMPSLRPDGRYLLLDHLQDPGNMGTILRTAEAFGIDCVIYSSDCADIWSPKVLRSTMGSTFRQPTVEVDSLPNAIATLQGAGVRVVGATLCSTAVTPQSLGGNGGVAVVVGNEGNGVRPEVLACCDGSVYIPMTDRVESLNAATAAAVLMWEISGRGRQ